MRYGSVCSGIEAATSAWHHMGWEPAFFSEIEAFPRAVLEHHYPEVPLHGDFTTIEQNQYGKIDLLVGGTPCQSFSVAGLRGGLDDDRGNLALEFCRLAQREQPRWIVWENVPGVLSSSGGRDFGSILGALEDLGYGLAYRVLDAQYFGVAQRRRRVFVVGYLGDWRPAAAVLFERHSMSGHPAPSREARKEAARAALSGTEERGGCGGDGPSVGWPADVACTLDTDFATKWGQNNQHVNAGCPLFVPDNVGTLSCNTGPNGNDAGNFACNQAVDAGHVLPVHVETVGTLRTRRPGEGGVQGDFDHIVPVISPALNTQSGSHHAPDTKAYVAYREVATTLTNSRSATQCPNEDTTLVGFHATSPKEGDCIVQQSERQEQRTIPTHDVVGTLCAEDSPHGARGLTGLQTMLAGYVQPVELVTPFDTTQITSPHNYSSPKEGDPCHPLAAGAHPPAIAFAQNTRDEVRIIGGDGEIAGALAAQPGMKQTTYLAIGFDAYNNDVTGNVSKTIDTGQDYHHVPNVFSFSSGDNGQDAAVDISPTIRKGGDGGGNMPAVAFSETAPTLAQGTGGGAGHLYRQAGNETAVAVTSSAVRRLTPVECERLQGFPDNFTAIPWKKKGPEQCPDGPRYKALGNSMAVPVMRWIGERIQLVDDLISIL